MAEVKMGAAAYAVARETLSAAGIVAREDGPVSDEWLRRTERLGSSTYRSFAPILGTALLARASFAGVNALALQAKHKDGGYNARGLHTNVLYPFAVDEGIDLRGTGREAYNGQPFYRHAHVDDIKDVRDPAEFRVLVENLKEVNSLDRSSAAVALCAFVRQRRQAYDQLQLPNLTDIPVDLDGFVSAAETFLDEGSDEGRRAQALVAAAFGVAWDVVRTSRVNDPSRRIPGDVQGIVGERPAVAAEVKDKPMNDSEVRAFMRSCLKRSVLRCIVVALDQRDPLAVAALTTEAREMGVMLSIYTDVRGLLEDALLWTKDSPVDVLASLPSQVGVRLKQVVASPESRRLWNRIATEMSAGRDGESEEGSSQLTLGEATASA